MPGFVAVHTGAGNCLNEFNYKGTCKEAAEIGTNIIRNGGTALDACEASIVHLENSEQTNAGFGSNLTWNGKIECEASIMDGATLRYGACTNVNNIANPIKLAKYLCEKQSKLLKFGRIPPMVLSGPGASEYAAEAKIPLIDTDKLKSQKALECFDHYHAKIAKYRNVNGGGGGGDAEFSALDTVGAVCIDNYGNCASGCSSGGLILKTSGRVGQAATYGAGCWAAKNDEKSVCTCTTGNGEYLMKTLLAKEIVDNLMVGHCSAIAINQTFNDKFLDSPYLANIDGLYGGALTVNYDRKCGSGEVIWSHTTQSFCLAFMSTSQTKPMFVLSNMPSYSKPGTTTVINAHHFKLPL